MSASSHIIVEMSDAQLKKWIKILFTISIILIAFSFILYNILIRITPCGSECGNAGWLESLFPYTGDYTAECPKRPRLKYPLHIPPLLIGVPLLIISIVLTLIYFIVRKRKNKNRNV